MATFNPMAIAKEKVMNRVRYAACHFSVAVESVRLSDVHRMVSGYAAFSELLNEGKLRINEYGILSIA